MTASRRDRLYLDELLGQINVQINELVVKEESALVNKTIGQLEVRGKGTFIIIALRRQDRTVIKNPDRSLILNPGDTVIAIGNQGDIPKFARLNEAKSQMRYRGSRIG